MAIIKPNNNTISAITALPTGVGGKVLQVVTATKTNETSTTANSMVSLGLSQSITPSATGSKILINMNINFIRKVTDSFISFKIKRDIGGSNTDIVDNIGNLDTGDSQQLTSCISFSFLDSPNTISSCTYSIDFQSSNGSILGASEKPSTLFLTEIGA